jgi:adenosylcobinamide-phosphate synthase
LGDPVRRGAALATGLLAGVAVDAVVGDPRRGHPVAAYGRAVAWAEERGYRDTKPAGAVLVACAVATPMALGALLPRHPVVIAAATWAALGGKTLAYEAQAVHALLAVDDLPAAREQLTHLVGRDPSRLDPGEIARAGVESVAENSSDAVVAPLLWGAVAGVPGLLGYRAVNTLDAMWGHRSPRYTRFGWSAARLDDLANLVPARVTAVLVTLLGGRPRQTWEVVRRDARRHPSPNSGWCEAAYAGALGIRLGGVNDYGGRVEIRPTLGSGRPADPGDLDGAATLLRRVTLASAGLAALIAWRRR